MLALMSLKRVKQVIVTDDDIDIFDPLAMDRASLLIGCGADPRRDRGRRRAA